MLKILNHINNENKLRIYKMQMFIDYILLIRLSSLFSLTKLLENLS